MDLSPQSRYNALSDTPFLDVALMLCEDDSVRFIVPRQKAITIFWYGQLG
jgi:hypothetical protein